MLIELSQAAYLILLLIFVPIPFATDRRIGSVPLVTYGLIAANTLIYFVLIFPTSGTGHQNDLFAMWGVIPRVPSFVTLFTSLFLHVSLAHLLWNMAFLWLFGPSCEDALGRVQYFVFYITGGVAAGLLHTAIVLLFAEHSGVAFAPLVGASGAISALVGMYALRFYRSKLRLVWLCASFLKLRTANLELPALAGLALWFLQNLVGAVYALFQPDRNGIAYWAHIGGFLFGMTVAEIAGMLGEGMREYLFADAVSAQVRGDEGLREAVANFRLLLQRHPEDDRVRDSLAEIAALSGSIDNGAVQQAVAEAYAVLLDEALTSGDTNRIIEWKSAFSELQAESIVGKPLLVRLASKSVRYGDLDFAEQIYRKVTERFPDTAEAKHAGLEIATIWLESRTRPTIPAESLLDLLGMSKKSQKNVGY